MNMVSRIILVLSLILGLQVIPMQSVEAASFSVNGIRIKKNVKNMKQLKHQHIVNQSLDFSCGAAGVSTLLNFYHNDPTEEKTIIQEMLRITPLAKVKARRGFSLLDLKRYLNSRGYTATGYKMDMDYLAGVEEPVLVPIKFKNYRHFVIVKDIIANRVFIADPAAGNMSVKVEKFAKMWTNGIGLVVEAKEGHELSKALAVKEEDLKVANYNTARRLVTQNIFRTAIFPDEY